MPVRYFGVHNSAGAGRLGLLGFLLVACCLAGCMEGPRARSFMEFMEDSYAREGALARCNRDREATAADLECVNARRAASMVAAQADAELREKREAESEALLVAARERASREQQAVERAQQAARAEAEAQYESQWSGSTEVLESDPEVPAAGHAGTYDSLASTLGVVGPPRPATLPVAATPAPAPAAAPVAPPAPMVSPDAPMAAEPVRPVAAPAPLDPALPVEAMPPAVPTMPLLDHVEVPTDAAPELLYVELPPGPQAANESAAQ